MFGRVGFAPCERMHLICIHKNASNDGDESLLRFAFTSDSVADVVLNGLSRCLEPEKKRSSVPDQFGRLDIGKTVFILPEPWRFDFHPDLNPDETHRRPLPAVRPEIMYYGRNVLIPFEHENVSADGGVRKPWLILSNGRFATNIDLVLLERVIHSVKADVVAVNADPRLLGEREEVRLTAEGKVAAFHRVYRDFAEFAFASADWPHHLFIRTSILECLLPGGVLPSSFSMVSNKCRKEGLKLRGVNVGGAVLDLGSDAGLLSFCGSRLSKSRNGKQTARSSQTLSETPRCIGDVFLGRDVNIASDVIIVGSSILCDKVRVARGAIIHSSILGPGVHVPSHELVQNRIIRGPQYKKESDVQPRGHHLQQISRLSRDFDSARDSCRSFRKWGRFSYARCLKRITDCLVAVAVLILFAPLIPFIALAIKLTSPGPVFYKDRRQGLYGKDFNCLKFRTMITGAHEIQEKLRIVSQVDGPQFKMEDDPRISTVGRFLRETYIDEIPQFINVLTGQMSVVGPRPSPESENTLCPLWRDARLSVRPGITGLWQVHRTRQPMRDFQEWIHYDIEYVRNLSLKTDLSVCWQTTRKLLDNFISQF